MCGINGIIGYREDAIEQIQLMNDQIIHRGPDAEGVWQNEDKTVTFGHRRLSIIDLSANGFQPMSSASGDYTVTFNGEIYNYLDIKSKLLDEYSCRFRGSSDTELLVEAVEHYGIDKTLELIKGMFAFAVFEKKTGNVYIARDRMGEKPLYYGRVAGNLVFASDLGSLEQIKGFDNEINRQILGSYFKGGYIPAPYSIYKDIFKLRPGCVLTIKQPYEKWEEHPYWDIREFAKKGQSNQFTGSFEEASDELERYIKDSIKNQMISDVPLGAFLSGGIDSSLTVALMQSISEKPVRTFTIGFEDKKYNEAEYAAETARHLGTVHTQMYVGKQDILDTIKDIPKAFTEPFADSSQIPTMLVSRMTKQHVTVSLSGDAGDEFYCGYNSYRDVRRGLGILSDKLSFIKGKPRRALGNVVYELGGKSNERLAKISAVLRIQTGEEWYRHVREDDVLLNSLVKDREQSKDNIDIYSDGFLEGIEPNLMLMDMLQYLPDDILVKVDRAGMCYSLESRIPLLDRDVMEFAWTLPQEYKYDGVTTKRILKNILYRYVPKEMMDRPKKGFSIPLSNWLRGDELNSWARELIEDSEHLMGEYVDSKVINKMWNKLIVSGECDRNIWNILMLAQWFRDRKG